MQKFKLISWNVAGWIRRLEGQFKLIEKWQPDILAIQETRKNGVDRFRSLLGDIGLIHCEHSLDQISGATKGVAIFSRWPLQRLDSFVVPFSHSTVSVSVQFDCSFDLHNVHIPNGSDNKWKKIETFEGVHDGISAKPTDRTILCGDFNSPQKELADGRVIVWGEKIRKDGTVVPTRDARWRNGEALFFHGLPKLGMPDVYRRCNGWEKEEFSWYFQRKTGVSPARRFDHIFAGESFTPVVCHYLHEGREMRLSDHSAIEGEFSIKKE